MLVIIMHVLFVILVIISYYCIRIVGTVIVAYYYIYVLFAIVNLFLVITI